MLLTTMMLVIHGKMAWIAPADCATARPSVHLAEAAQVRFHSHTPHKMGTNPSRLEPRLCSLPLPQIPAAPLSGHLHDADVQLQHPRAWFRPLNAAGVSLSFTSISMQSMTKREWPGGCTICS